MDLPNLTMASPDTGGTKRAAAYAKFLNTDLVICLNIVRLLIKFLRLESSAMLKIRILCWLMTSLTLPELLQKLQI